MEDGKRYCQAVLHLPLMESEFEEAHPNLTLDSPDRCPPDTELVTQSVNGNSTSHGESTAALQDNLIMSQDQDRVIDPDSSLLSGLRRCANAPSPPDIIVTTASRVFTLIVSFFGEALATKCGRH
jgi:hypothetical protein